MFKFATYRKFKHIFNSFHFFLNDLYFAWQWPYRPKRVIFLNITEYNKFLFWA
jgi:hypothetical protein